MLTIRQAVADDGRRLADIDASTRTPSVSPAPPPQGRRTFWAPGLRPDDVVVAEEDGEVVGSVVTGHPTPLPSNQHVREIKGLAVDPPCQRTGVARGLLDEVLHRAHADGIQKVSLRVLATNQPARRLYESLGFEVEGVLRNEFRIAGASVDDVLMARHLHG